MSVVGIGDAFRLALSTKKEEYRALLVKYYSLYQDKVLQEVAKRVGGEVVPDTVIASTAVEVVIAALTYNAIRGNQKPLKLIIPSEPTEGWGPLNEIAELLASQGKAQVYRVKFTPSVRTHAKSIGVKLGRILKGVSPRVVDVTDAPAYFCPALYSANIRTLSVLVDAGHVALFQKVNFTLVL